MGSVIFLVLIDYQVTPLSHHLTRTAAQLQTSRGRSYRGYRSWEPLGLSWRQGWRNTRIFVSFAARNDSHCEVQAEAECCLSCIRVFPSSCYLLEVSREKPPIRDQQNGLETQKIPNLFQNDFFFFLFKMSLIV